MNQLCQCGVACGGQARATARHHRKRRGQGGPNTVGNLLLVCLECHEWIHAHPEESFENGWLIQSWVPNDQVADVPYSKPGERAHGSATSATHSHAEVSPGDQCPTCHRRVPKPKEEQEGAKKRGTWSIRVPKYTADGDKTPFDEDGAALLDERIQAGRKRLAVLRGWEPNVPAYFVAIALMDVGIMTLRDAEEGVLDVSSES